MLNYVMDKRFKKILKITSNIEKNNHELIKNKLSTYKQLMKHIGILEHEIEERKILEQKNENIVDISRTILWRDKEIEKLLEKIINIVQNQHIIIKEIRGEIIDSDYQRQLEYTNNNIKMCELVGKGETILKKLSNTFHSQKVYLTDKKLSIEEKIKEFKGFFHDELKYYKEYDELLKELPDVLKKDLKYLSSNEFKRKKNFKENITLYIIINMIICMISSEYARSHFGDLEQILKTSAAYLSIAIIVSGYYKEILKKIKEINKKIKKELKKEKT